MDTGSLKGAFKRPGLGLVLGGNRDWLYPKIQVLCSAYTFTDRVRDMIAFSFRS